MPQQLVFLSAQMLYFRRQIQFKFWHEAVVTFWFMYLLEIGWHMASFLYTTEVEIACRKNGNRSTIFIIFAGFHEWKPIQDNCHDRWHLRDNDNEESQNIITSVVSSYPGMTRHTTMERPRSRRPHTASWNWRNQGIAAKW